MGLREALLGIHPLQAPVQKPGLDVLQIEKPFSVG
jgi:hypothetical protein